MDDFVNGFLQKFESFFGASLLLLAVTLCVFSPCLSAGFLNWDDPTHLLKNPLLPLHDWVDIARIFLTGDTGNRTYNPLVILSFGVEWLVGGLHPFIFHLDNILLHALAAILVRVLALRMGLSARGALVAALIFAIHPMRVESVAWVTERKDVLFGFFYLGALILYWDYLQSAQGKNYVGALLCAIASIMAKPMALSLPLVLFLFDRMTRRRWTRMAWIDKVPFMLTLWPLAGITLMMNIRHPVESCFKAVLIGIYSATFYVIKFFVPYGLAIIYPVPRPVSWVTLEYFWAMPLLVAVLVLVWLYRRDRWVKFAFVFYVFTMFFLWRIDLFDGAKGIVSDRFMYIPCLGFSLLLGHWGERVFLFNNASSSLRRLFLGRLLAGILLVVLASVTFHRCFAWRDNLVFWGDVLRNDPDNTFALFNRAVCLLEDQDVARRYALSDNVRNLAALRDLQKAAFRAPRDPDIWNNLGIVLGRLGRTAEAGAAFAKVDKLGGVVK